jgi:hypothetical protein
VAKNLKEMQGFETKQDYSRWLCENIKIPAGQYWGSDIIYSFILPMAQDGIEPYKTWMELPPDELITPYHIPENIEMVVVGGETNAFWKTTDFRYVTSASVDAWR